MLGVKFLDINKRIRIRNKGHEILLLVTNEDGEFVQELKVTEPEKIELFEIFRGYMIGLNNKPFTNSNERYEEIINNFKLTFNV